MEARSGATVSSTISMKINPNQFESASKVSSTFSNMKKDFISMLSHSRLGRFLRCQRRGDLGLALIRSLMRLPSITIGLILRLCRRVKRIGALWKRIQGFQVAPVRVRNQNRSKTPRQPQNPF